MTYNLFIIILGTIVMVLMCILLAYIIYRMYIFINKELSENNDKNLPFYLQPQLQPDDQLIN